MDVEKKARKEIRKKIEKKSIKNQLPPITCKCGCGSTFIPKSRKQHYFNDEHREDYYNRTYYSRELVKKVCPNCGEKFKTTKPGRQVYCKPSCREEARDKRKENLTTTVQSQRHEFYGERYKQMEADGFACRLCGKMARDGVKLDVGNNGSGGNMTICNECSQGRKASGYNE